MGALKSQKKILGYNVLAKQLSKMLVNHRKQADAVIQVGKTLFKDRLGRGSMPVLGSEDFAYYVDKVPGAFFFLASGRKDNDTMIHESNFDFNDNLIEDATEFWMRLALNRFGLKYL